MKFIFLLKLYLATLTIFMVLDFVWLGFLAKDFYYHQLGFLLADNQIVWAAGVFYVLYTFALLYFVVLPALKAKNIALYRVLFAGALFGLVCYATYDLTNYATIKDWPWLVVVIDLFWGMFLTANVSAVSFLIGRNLSK